MNDKSNKKPQPKIYNIALTESELIRIEHALDIALVEAEQAARYFSGQTCFNRRGNYLHEQQAKQSCVECRELLDKIVKSHM